MYVISVQAYTQTKRERESSDKNLKWDCSMQIKVAGCSTKGLV